MLASCQTTRSVLAPRPFQSVLSMGSHDTSATTVVLMHDSQGPQGTRVVMSTAEAASFSYHQ